jgi:Mor family transcriptional regulator
VTVAKYVRFPDEQQPHRITPNELRKIFALYNEQVKVNKINYNEIADKLQLSYQQVFSSIRHSPNWKQRRFPVTEEKAKEIVTLYKKQVAAKQINYSTICRTVGFTPMVIRKVLEREGLYKRKRFASRRLQARTKASILEEYINLVDGLSKLALSKKYKIAYSLVDRVIREAIADGKVDQQTVDTINTKWKTYGRGRKRSKATVVQVTPKAVEKPKVVETPPDTVLPQSNVVVTFHPFASGDASVVKPATEDKGAAILTKLGLDRGEFVDFLRACLKEAIAS